MDPFPIGSDSLSIAPGVDSKAKELGLPEEISLLEELFPSDHKATPASKPLFALLQGLGRVAVRTTRNKHKIYTILLRSRDIYNHILAAENNFGDLNGKHNDPEVMLGTMEQCYELTDALERILLEVATFLPAETQDVELETLRSWAQSQASFTTVWNVLSGEPFEDIPLSPGTKFADSSYFDDCAWLSRLLHRVIEREIALQFPEDRGIPEGIIPVNESFMLLENLIKCRSSSEKLRNIVIEMATLLAIMLVETKAESLQGEYSDLAVSNRDSVLNALAAIFSTLNSDSLRSIDDTSALQIPSTPSAGSAGPSHQDAKPTIPQSSRQVPTPRSMTTPYPFHPYRPAATLAPHAINILPPARQPILASKADSPTPPIPTSQPTPTHEQIAICITQLKALAFLETESDGFTKAGSTPMNTMSEGRSNRPSISLPARSEGETSPTNSSIRSFITMREGHGDADMPLDDAINVDSSAAKVFAEEEPAASSARAEPPISLTMRQLPFAEPAARPNQSWTASWTAYQPVGVSSSSTHLSPNLGASPDSAESDWMNYLAVDRKLVGKVKKPQGTPFACGGFSDVFKCEVRFDAPDDGNPKMVAVKVLRPVGLDGYSESEALQKMIERASREAHAWLAIYHPNVVPLVGFTFTPLLSLVSPWHEKGNIRSYLISNPTAERVKLLLDIARGLAYLHSRNPPVVHGNIKPENILINDQGDALITDFGLVMVIEANPWYSSSHRQAGSVRWMAPELLLNGKETRSCSSDVYSYGGVALEVMTSELPHRGRSEPEISIAIGDPNAPKDPVDEWAKYPQVPEVIKEMIVKCWSRRSEKRPTMRGIEERLGKLVT